MTAIYANIYMFYTKQRNVSLKEAVAINTELTIKSIAETVLEFQLDKTFIRLTALLSVSLSWMQGE